MPGREDHGDRYVSLNRSERLYLALEGIAGSVTQVYAIRLTGPVTAEGMRKAFRAVVRAHPRLRGVVEPTHFGHRLRIRPDDATVDALVEAAFRVEVEGPTDDEALGLRQSALLNEPFAVERDLLIRGVFIPNAERPTVILSMNHIAGDGRSVLAWIRSLHRALNGEELPILPVDPPGHAGAVLPRGPLAFLKAATGAVAGLAHGARYSGAPLEPPSKRLPTFAPAAVLPVRMRAPASSLVRAARARGTTLGTLLFAAVAVVLRRVIHGQENAFIRARQSIDLRDLFPDGKKPADGNYVSTFVVDVDPRGGLDALVAEIDAETKVAIDRFAKRETMLGELSSEMQTWVGRKVLGSMAVATKKRDRLPRQTFHLSNLGRIEGFDQGAIQVETIIPSLPHTHLFVAGIGFRGVLYVTVNYQRGEISEDFVRAFARELDQVLVELADAAPAKQPGHGATA